MKTKRIIAAAAALVLVLASCLSVIGCQTDPYKILERSLKNTAKTVETDPGRTLYENGATVEVEIPLGFVLEQLLGELGEVAVTDASLVGKISSAGQGAESSVLLSLKAGGETKANAILYRNGEYVAIASEELLGGSYGLSFEGQKEKFDNSIFGKNGALSLGVDYDELTEMFRQSNSEKDGAEAEDRAKEAKKFLGDEYALLKKYSDAKTEKGSVSFEETEVGTTDVVLALTGEKLYNYLAEAVDMALDYVEKLGLSGALGNMTVNGADGEKLAESVADAKEKFHSELEESREDVEKLNVEAVFHTTKSNEIVGFDAVIKAVEDDEERTVTLTSKFGPKPSEPAEITFDLETNDGDETESLASFRIENESSEEKFTSDLDLSMNGEKTVDGSLEIDKTNEKYSISIGSPEELISADGEYSLEKDGIRVTLDKINAGKNQSIELGAAVSIKSSADIEKITEYDDILDVTEAKAEELTGSLAENLLTLIADLLGIE